MPFKEMRRLTGDREGDMLPISFRTEVSTMMMNFTILWVFMRIIISIYAILVYIPKKYIRIVKIK